MSDDTELDAIAEPPPLVADVNDANTVVLPPPAPPRLDLGALDEISRADPSLFEDRGADPVFTRQVLTTPLHFYVASESLTNLWCNWNGYTVADQLTNLDDEYAALRHGAALTDISPLVKYRISGPDAFAWLRRLVTGNLATLAVDDIKPVIFCEDRGFVVGDGLLFRLGDSDFRLVTEEHHLAWLIDSTIGHRVHIEDVSTTLAAMSLQGPLSCTALSDAGFSGIENLPPFKARWFNVTGMPVYVSRTGTSGDLGYELWIDPDDAPILWLRLLEKGKIHGLKAGGFALRELARIEAGIPRAGVDYLGAFSVIDPQNALTPFELGYASLVDLDGEHFTGREALRKARSETLRYILTSVAVDWPSPLSFTAIRDASGIAGISTSTGFSPSLGVNLALAIFHPVVADGVKLHVQSELQEELSLRLINAPARIVPVPALLLPARHLVPAPLALRR
tara:strand:+ start:3142 stop:4497 length:1356 start_codon:yes stop_codon:yes gene_type:complete